MIKTENSVFNIRYSLCESPRQRISNCSTFRFGLAPLEAIEESQTEDAQCKEDNLNIYSHKSHQISPRLQFFEIEKSAKPIIHNTFISEKRSQNTKKKTVKKKIISPYAEVFYFTPQRLPSLNNTERKLKFLKNHAVVKRKNIQIF